MEERQEAANFIEAEINKDIANNVYENGRVLTRFPPEPNGYLHIGHVKSICLNFGLGEKYHGETNVRFDDTNPAKEEIEYVNSILEDIKWLGFKWKEPVHYASDYFPQLYEFACKLIRMGLAYEMTRPARKFMIPAVIFYIPVKKAHGVTAVWKKICSYSRK